PDADSAVVPLCVMELLRFASLLNAMPSSFRWCAVIISATGRSQLAPIELYTYLDVLALAFRRKMGYLATVRGKIQYQSIFEYSLYPDLEDLPLASDSDRL